MIVKWFEPRLKIWTWTDSRLQNEEGRYCLCTRCIKTSLSTDGDQSRTCKRHDDFVKMRMGLNLASPVFACPDFEERPEHEDLILIGLQRELSRSTMDELVWAMNRLSDFIRGRNEDKPNPT